MKNNQLKQDAINYFKNKNMPWIASLLNQITIQDVQEDCLAYISPDDLGTIYIGKKFFDSSVVSTSKQQFGVLAHEAMHIPQIKTLQWIRNMYFWDKRQSMMSDEALLKFIDRNSVEFLNFRRLMENYGLDAEVNEDLRRLSVPLPDNLVYPEGLPEICQSQESAPDNNSEYLPFVQYCIDNYKDDENNENEDNSTQSNLNPDDWGTLVDDIIDQAIDDLTEYEQENSNTTMKDLELASSAAHSVGINIEKLLKTKGKLPKKIEKLCKGLIKKLKPIRGEKTIPSYSWSRKHRAFPSQNFPDLITTKFIKRTEKVVVVIDTSYSAWNLNVNQKLGVDIADFFLQKGLLSQAYFCDTELYKIDMNNIDVKGGGGTEFGKRHINTIIKDTGEDISILYITDGDLDLKEVSKIKDTHVLIAFDCPPNNAEIIKK